MAPPPAGRDDGGARANPGGKITRDVVLAAALELIDRDGADGLSMRRLARVLGRDPMILYRHAPNKAALLDGVAETVLAQLKVDPADPDWAGQLRAVARGYRALALAHPKVVPLLVTRPLATPLGLRPPGTLRPLEDILALLTRAGFSGTDALHIYRALFRIPARPRPGRAAGTHREPGRDRRPAAAGPAPAADPRIPPAAQPRPRPGLLRRRRRARARPRHPPHRPDRLADPRPAAQPGPGPPADDLHRERQHHLPG
jgi:AcrR family transcriptional regulator